MRLLVGPGLRDPQGNPAFFVDALCKNADVRRFDQSIQSLNELLALWN